MSMHDIYNEVVKVRGQEVRILVIKLCNYDLGLKICSMLKASPNKGSESDKTKIWDFIAMD